jgi:2-keto-myo-inositol isomerase
MFPFKLSLNTSTLAPFKLDVKQQIQVAAEAGYTGIELWMRDIEAYVTSGGQLSTLKEHLEKTGLSLVNVITFFKWADHDASVRKQGLIQARREVQILAELGCKAVAAAPFGDVAAVTLDEMSIRFAELTEMTRSEGIEAYLEFWGRAPKLSRLSEAVYVAMESCVTEPKLLVDPFHMYTGGSSVEGLRLLDGSSIGIVHVNDYPVEPLRDDILDRDRVYPGDGIAPLGKFAQYLSRIGYQGYLSLELFIEDYGTLSALEVARIGIEKTKRTFSV